RGSIEAERGFAMSTLFAEWCGGQAPHGYAGRGEVAPAPFGEVRRPARRNAARRGFASALAMLFLMLFAVMAIGFYAATTMSAQIAANERRGAASQMATESGMNFLRYELGQVRIAGMTDDAQVLQQVYSQLKARLN